MNRRDYILQKLYLQNHFANWNRQVGPNLTTSTPKGFMYLYHKKNIQSMYVKKRETCETQSHGIMVILTVLLWRNYAIC